MGLLIGHQTVNLSHGKTKLILFEFPSQGIYQAACGLTGFEFQIIGENSAVQELSISTTPINPDGGSTVQVNVKATWSGEDKQANEFIASVGVVCIACSSSSSQNSYTCIYLGSKEEGDLKFTPTASTAFLAGFEFGGGWEDEATAHSIFSLKADAKGIEIYDKSYTLTPQAAIQGYDHKSTKTETASVGVLLQKTKPGERGYQIGDIQSAYFSTPSSQGGTAGPIVFDFDKSISHAAFLMTSFHAYYDGDDSHDIHHLQVGNSSKDPVVIDGATASMSISFELDNLDGSYGKCDVEFVPIGIFA